MSIIYVFFLLQPSDNWGMKLAPTPCGRSVWVSHGIGEIAVQIRGMDALTRLPDGWIMELESGTGKLVYYNRSINKRQYEAPVDKK